MYNIIETSGIDKDVVIGHFNHIQGGVCIKSGTKIGNYCEIEKGVQIYENCIIQGRIRIGPQAVIENNVTIKYGTIITDKALIHSNTFIGPNVITLGAEANKIKMIGAEIGSNCFIGAGTKIACGVNICEGVVIGANSFVNADIVESGTYVGSPAKIIKRR
jgi:UDP-3-O-[3-hydroxymyristoyl] glucosamine N-acyltransferase